MGAREEPVRKERRKAGLDKLAMEAKLNRADLGEAYVQYRILSRLRACEHHMHDRVTRPARGWTNSELFPPGQPSRCRNAADDRR